MNNKRTNRTAMKRTISLNYHSPFYLKYLEKRQNLSDKLFESEIIRRFKRQSYLHYPILKQDQCLCENEQAINKIKLKRLIVMKNNGSNNSLHCTKNGCNREPTIQNFITPLNSGNIKEISIENESAHQTGIDLALLSIITDQWDNKILMYPIPFKPFADEYQEIFSKWFQLSNRSNKIPIKEQFNDDEQTKINDLMLLVKKPKCTENKIFCTKDSASMSFPKTYYPRNYAKNFVDDLLSMNLSEHALSKSSK